MIISCTNAHFSSTPLLLYSVCYRAFLLRNGMKIFITAFLQVFLGSANAFFIFKLNYIGIAITGFLMSYLWSFNVKKIAFSNQNDRLVYGVGAMFGSLSGVFISNSILNAL